MSNFKVGDRVRRISHGCVTVSVGDIGEVISIFDDCNTYRIKRPDGKEQTWAEDRIELFNPTIVIYTKANETIATLKQGKEVIKTAKAKCNPSDTFDFEIGAKLAFERLLGEDELVEKSTFDWDGFKQGKFAVHCDTEEKAKAFLKECDEHGIVWCTETKISDQKESRWDIYKQNTSYGCDSYGGLMFGTFGGISKIDYATSKPAVKEVKRPAKVGEWIKIIDAWPCPDKQSYKTGDIFRVTKTYAFDANDVDVDGVEQSFIDYTEYVVLENYSPTEPIKEKSLSDYTDSEILEDIKRRMQP